MRKFWIVLLALVLAVGSFGTASARPLQTWTLVLSDGFETGDFSKWTSTSTTGNGSLIIENASACPADVGIGNYCMDAYGPDSGGKAWVTDHDYVDDTQFYKAQWIGRMRTNATSTSDPARVMFGRDASGNVMFAVQLVSVSGTPNYRARMTCKKWDDTMVATSWLNVPNHEDRLPLSIYGIAQVDVQYIVGTGGSCTLTLTDLDLDQNGGHQSVSDTVSLNNTGNKLFSIELGVPYQPSGFWVSHYVDEFKEWTQ